MHTPCDPNEQSSNEEELEVNLRQGKSIEQRPVAREQTASYIGYIIVGTFTFSVVACFIVVFINVWREQDLDASFELFKTVSALMSGPLGFVLGFYFRESQ